MGDERTQLRGALDGLTGLIHGRDRRTFVRAC
jgi:hypothetical protein